LNGQCENIGDLKQLFTKKNQYSKRP